MPVSQGMSFGLEAGSSLASMRVLHGFRVSCCGSLSQGGMGDDLAAATGQDGGRHPRRPLLTRVVPLSP